VQNPAGALRFNLQGIDKSYCTRLLPESPKCLNPTPPLHTEHILCWPQIPEGSGIFTVTYFYGHWTVVD
jgi:hypothetical protein